MAHDPELRALLDRITELTRTTIENSYLRGWFDATNHYKAEETPADYAEAERKARQAATVVDEIEIELGDTVRDSDGSQPTGKVIAILPEQRVRVEWESGVVEDLPRWELTLA